jgi:hypothetical protein
MAAIHEHDCPRSEGLCALQSAEIAGVTNMAPDFIWVEESGCEGFVTGRGKDGVDPSPDLTRTIPARVRRWVDEPEN